MAERLTEHLQNPLLTKNCIALLKQYRSVVGRNKLLLCETLAEAAKVMPEKYPTLEAWEQAYPDWLSNRFYWLNNLYIDKFEDLKPTANTIIEYIREYFDPDNLRRL